jgi:hypothetical protein
LISLGIFDQPEHRHRVVRSGFQAFADERTARIRPLAGHGSELLQAFVEQPFAVIDRRLGARSVSF